MLITNEITDYSPEEVAEMQAKINEFVATIKELDDIIEKEAVDPTPPEEASDNVIYLDATPLAEFSKFETVSLPLHEMLNVYDRWIEKYNYMVKVNVGQYKNVGLLMYLIKLRNVCISFGKKKD